MQSVGAFEAKTHLSALLDRVARGETIVITKRGVPVARLSPAEHDARQDLRKVAQEIRQFRKGVRLGRLTVRRLIQEGRRF
jgi:prevent-host-death family protein